MYFQNRAAVLQQQTNFSSLHDFARHAIHSSETLDVATETVTSMVRQHEWFSDAGQPYVSMDVTALRHTRQYLDYQLQMIRSLRARSKANEERLRNEIALAGFEAGSLNCSFLMSSRRIIPSRKTTARSLSGLARMCDETVRQ